MARYDYGYVRSWDDPKYLQQLHDQGYGGALFAMDDPRLPELVAQARQLGLQYGIWGAPNQTPNGTTMTNAQYAQRMSDLVRQYGASVASLDLEFPYKGAKGSAEWNRSAELAAMWKQMVPQGVQTWVAPMGSAWAGTQPQGDQMFNYGAWQGIATGWNPQAYGATLDQKQDPRLVVQGLINAGVPADQIAPLLAPGQDYGGGALYGLNEFGDLPKASAPAPRSQATGGQAAPTRSTTSRYAGPIQAVKGRLGLGASQSQQRVQQQGLHWGGQVFSNKKDFSRYLAQRGNTYANWAAQHRPAAAGLNQRPRRK